MDRQDKRFRSQSNKEQNEFPFSIKANCLVELDIAFYWKAVSFSSSIYYSAKVVQPVNHLREQSTFKCRGEIVRSFSIDIAKERKKNVSTSVTNSMTSLEDAVQSLQQIELDLTQLSINSIWRENPSQEEK